MQTFYIEVSMIVKQVFHLSGIERLLEIVPNASITPLLNDVHLRGAVNVHRDASTLNPLDRNCTDNAYGSFQLNSFAAQS